MFPKILINAIIGADYSMYIPNTRVCRNERIQERNAMGEMSVFISYRHDDGYVLAKDIASRLKAANMEPWIWKDDHATGAVVREDYLSAVRNADAFIPVISQGYLGSPGCDNELKEAISRFEALKSHPSRRRFIFPIKTRKENDLPIDLQRLGLTFCLPEECEKLIEDVKIEVHDAFHLLDRSGYSFNNWPDPLLPQGPEGGIDALIVIGHSEKKSDIGKSSPPPARVIAGTRLASAAYPQTNRPAEFIPQLVSSLEWEYLRRNSGAIGKLRDFQRASCYTDENLIEFHSEEVAKHNLICLGAGDTNGVTKWILDYYANVLPISFDASGSSHGLLLDSKSGAILHMVAELDPNGTKAVIAYQGGAKSDHALLAILPNPANPKKVAVIVAGLVALGTQGGILALSKWWAGLKEDAGVGRNWLRVIEAEGRANFRATGYKIIV